jgi:tetratricopeptide (TPR) repeat protein
MVVNSGISSASIPGHASICSTCQSFKDWYAEGEELASRQQFQKALRCFEEASILEPDSLSAVLYRGVCLIHLNQPQKALNILKALLEQEPDHSQGWLFYGVALHRLGQYEAAYASYQKALGQTPRSGIMARLRHRLQQWVSRLGLNSLAI